MGSGRYGFQSYSGLANGSGDIMGKQRYHKKLWKLMGVYYYMECITELAKGYSCGLELLMGYGGDLTFNGGVTTKKWNIMGPDRNS